jgi:hypothetical protein
MDRISSMDMPILSLSASLMLLLFVSPLSPLSPCLADASRAAPGQSIGGSLTLGGPSGPEISLEVPASVSDWILVPKERNERKIALNIRTRESWTLLVSSDRADGRMAEYDPAASEYVPAGRSLQGPLRISAPGTSSHPASWEIELPHAGAIQQTAGIEKEGSSTVTVTLQQPVSWEDEPLADGHVYRIDLTFSVSPNG